MSFFFFPNFAVKIFCLVLYPGPEVFSLKFAVSVFFGVIIKTRSGRCTIFRWRRQAAHSFKRCHFDNLTTLNRPSIGTLTESQSTTMSGLRKQYSAVF